VHCRMVFDRGFRIERDHQRFLAACEWLIVRLEAQLARHATVQPWPAVLNRPQAHKSLSVSVVVAAALIAIVLSTNPSGHTDWTHRPILTGIQFLAVLLVTVFLTTRATAKRR
jgi:hypothetical protein